jgi:hypothetical protein
MGPNVLSGVSQVSNLGVRRKVGGFLVGTSPLTRSWLVQVHLLELASAQPVCPMWVRHTAGRTRAFVAAHSLHIPWDVQSTLLLAASLG